jgi:hypothetical protein
MQMSVQRDRSGKFTQLLKKLNRADSVSDSSSNTAEMYHSHGESFVYSDRAMVTVSPDGIPESLKVQYCLVKARRDKLPSLQQSVFCRDGDLSRLCNNLSNL